MKTSRDKKANQNVLLEQIAVYVVPDPKRGKSSVYFVVYFHLKVF